MHNTTHTPPPNPDSPADAAPYFLPVDLPSPVCSPAVCRLPPTVAHPASRLHGSNTFVYRQQSCASMAEMALRWQHRHPPPLSFLMRSCYVSAIIDIVPTKLVPARPTVVCRSTPVLKKHHESQRARRPIKTASHSNSKWRGCSSEVREVKLMHRESRRYTRLSWSLTSCFDIVWCEGACAGRRVHMPNPCPLCRPQDDHVSISPPSTFRVSNGDKNYHVP